MYVKVILLGLVSFLASMPVAGQRPFLADETIPQWIERNQEDFLSITSPGLPIPSAAPGGRGSLERVACGSDVILLGVVERQQSKLTPDEKSVVTELDVRVTGLVKAGDVGHASLISVQRPGGSVKVGDHWARVRYRSFHSLRPNRSYLLFLRRIPETGNYHTFDPFSAFELGPGTEIFKTTDEQGIASPRQRPEMIREVRAMLASCQRTAPEGARPAVVGPADRNPGDGFPVVDDSTARNDHVPAHVRINRSRRFDSATAGVDVRRFQLSETSPPIALQLPADHGPAFDLFPVRSSDAIIVGKVTQSKAHLSNDKTQVYSEFVVSVERAIKGQVGSVVDVQRYGGKVRFANGKTLVRGEYGKDLPRAGNRYILFLRSSDTPGDYTVLTGYELSADRAISLDARWPKSARDRGGWGASESSLVELIYSEMANAEDRR